MLQTFVSIKHRAVNKLEENMDELKKGLSLSVTGEQADRALCDCLRQVRQWGLSLPDIEPLVLDFGLRDFENSGLIEFWIANETQAGYCGKFLFVFGGQTCPEHRHQHKHETFYLIKGQLQVRLGGKDYDLVEGDVLPVPVGKPHGFTGIGPALILELSMPCEIEDNEFSNPAIPIGRGYSSRDSVALGSP